MRIMVTGSEGSLAQAVIPHLLSEGHDVLGIDNHTRYGKVDRERAYAFESGDLCDGQFLESLFDDDRFDAVLHCAALVYGVVGFHARPGDILADNTLPVINLLRHGREKMGRFI